MGDYFNIPYVPKVEVNKKEQKQEQKQDDGLVSLEQVRQSILKKSFNYIIKKGKE